LFCIECGKANPDGAKFCAYCGVKLFTGEPVPTIEPIPAASDAAPAQPIVPPADDVPPKEEAVQAEAPAQEPVKQPEQPAPYVRARRARTLQPTMENPAQPDRGPRAEFVPQPFVQISPVDLQEMPAKAERIEEEPLLFQEEMPLNVEADPDEPEPFFPRKEAPVQTGAWNAKNKQDKPSAPILPPDDLWPGDEEEEPSEPAEKKKFSFPWQKKKEEDLVLTASGTEEMPARKPVITRKKRDTHIPERIIKRKEPEPEEERFEDDEEPQDVFFMRPKKPRRQEDDSIDDAYVNSRVRSILFAIAFVTCLFAAVWLFATSSGQMFLAGFNLSSSAEAYRDLGDSALGNNQVKRAAEAYYKALSLDPDDYETALLVGKTQQQIGEYDTAADAYYMCTKLQPTSPEPYQALIRLYEIQNEQEKAQYFRELGRANAGLN